MNALERLQKDNGQQTDLLCESFATTEHFAAPNVCADEQSPFFLRLLEESWRTF